MKGFLISRHKEFRKTHNISELLQAALELDSRMAALRVIGVEKLTVYAIEIRYPDDFYTPDVHECAEAIALARQCRDIIRNLIAMTK